MPPSPSATRRTVLALSSLAPLGLAAGCTGSATSPGGDTPHPDPDEALLDEVRDSTSNLYAQVEAVLGSPDGRLAAAALGELRACLDVHLAEFGPSSDSSAAAKVAPTDAPATSVAPTLAGVLTTARAHQVALTDACARAESGNFARLLACAAAGVAQHVVAVDAAAPKEGRR